MTSIEINIGKDAFRARFDALNELTAELTGFNTFNDLVNAPGHFPSLCTYMIGGDAWKKIAMADAYDAFQESVGDPRRAHRF